MELTYLYDVGIFLAVFVVNFYGAISGGVGLIMRPLLIFAGLPPQVAIGTTRLANVGTRLIGLTQFKKHSKIDWKLSFILMFPATIGTIIGVQLVLTLDTETLTRVVGFMILLAGFNLLYNKKKGVVADDSPKGWPSVIVGYFMYGFSTFIGTIAGGGAVVNNFILIQIHKKTYIEAAAIRKIAGFGGSLIGGVLFFVNGLIDWYYFVLVLFAAGLGIYFGTKFGIHKGEEWVRNVMLFVVFVFGIKMLFF